ncbi:MAG: hypothetical protein OXI16_08415 [Chloroflexota bacterium]|nr:hypothetical protein [Chloroflexota bacterium]MDE2687500.1 hypothetical protein [Chloroflexota bacterium]
MSTEAIEYTDELGLSDRGVGVQATGFAVVGCVSVAILHIFSGSEHLLYFWFEMAATRLYWAFVVPLAALFDWGRMMFAKGKAIREAKKTEILAKATREAIEQERKRYNAKMRAWAKERGIPESDLPFEDLGD